MQKNKYSIAIFVAVFTLNACVQKTKNQVVTVKLNVNGATNIKTVGVRGKGKPLSWQKDIALTPIVKDSLYTATFTTITGYKKTDIKFTINDQFELEEQPNRTVVFSPTDTTIYEATFNVVKK
jgi:putative oxidoreductase